MRFLGIDPGKSGGIALLYSDWNPSVDYWKMPETERDIWEIIQAIAIDANESQETTHCYIESVSPHPREGVRSVWTFSGNYHLLRMALTAANIPFEAIRPTSWQKGMKLTKKFESKTARKNYTKAASQRLFPSVKITHSISEALLLAEYCRRTFQVDQCKKPSLQEKLRRRSKSKS